MVDYVVGKLPQKGRIRVEQHLTRCLQCRRQVEGWRTLLYALPAAQRPPRRLKRRLIFSFLLRKGIFRNGRRWVTRFFSFPLRHKRAVLFSFLLFFLASGSLLLWQNRPSFTPITLKEPPYVSTVPQGGGNSPYTTVSSLGKEEAPFTADYPFIFDPLTVRYDVISLQDEQVHGYVWINSNSQEVLLIMEEVLPLAEKDYQVWMREKRNASNLGLLQIEKRGAHLYYQGEASQHGEGMTISLEPKGGSLIPTGPDQYVVHFR